MKIMYGSDLHLEFVKSPKDIPAVPACDLLLLAGDIFTPWGMTEHDEDIVNTFFERCQSNATKTLMVLGNHEHYNGTFVDTANIVKDTLEPYNIQILDNTTYQDKDLKVFGATLWTDLRNNHPEVVWDAQRNMSEYKCVKFSKSHYNPYNVPDPKLRAADTLNENHYTRQKIESFLQEEGRLIVMTHMAPDYDTCTEQHNNLSFAYANTDINLYDAKPHQWVYGHMHSRKEGQIGNCKHYRNARGYIGYEAYNFTNTFEFKHLPGG